MGHYKCCCCVPLRAGVLIIALLSSAIYIVSTVGLFLSKTHGGGVYDGYNANTPVFQGVFYTAVAVSILFALASLFGVVGSISQHRKMIAVFKLVYWTVAIIDFVVCVASIVVLGLSRSAVIEACSRLYVDETTDTCSAGYRNFMIIYSVIVMIVCFIQFYFASAISAYATRLRRTNLHEKLRNLEDFPEPPSKTEFF